MTVNPGLMLAHLPPFKPTTSRAGWHPGEGDGACNEHPLWLPLQPSQPQALLSCCPKKKVMPFPSQAQFTGSPAVATLPLSVLKWGFAAPPMQGHRNYHHLLCAPSAGCRKRLSMTLQSPVPVTALP